ncbi:hypothetical protein [Dickeya lacustris]|uniref:Uncharacterized protein n=1 Tax=Dickeya lacustris TaxID=2259638 RepID=A0ABY8G6L4_9GAMM|nr:hypothetical protein [Dickeya lacustris]WFN55595.1 hypothetical protein O1Q98_18780 [Dickeya lacustris]
MITIKKVISGNGRIHFYKKESQGKNIGFLKTLVTVVAIYLFSLNGVAYAKTDKVQSNHEVLKFKISFVDSCDGSDPSKPVYITASTSGGDITPIQFDIKNETSSISSVSAILYPKRHNGLSDTVDVLLNYTITSIDGIQKIGDQNSIVYAEAPITSQIMQRINITTEKSKPVSIVSGIPCSGRSKENWRYKLTLERL